MFVDVETFFLDARLNTQAVQFLDAVEEDESTGGCPEVDNEDAEALCTEETPTKAIECTVACREQTCQQGAENTADTMYRGCTYRVVDVQLVVDELDGEDEYGTADETDDDSSNGRYEVATCRDTHETCQDAVEGQ